MLRSRPRRRAQTVVTCPDATHDRVTSCSYDNGDGGDEVYPSAYPIDNTRCRCYQGAGAGVCIANCWPPNGLKGSSHPLRNYKREVTYGIADSSNGFKITARCSDNQSVAFGCGFDFAGIDAPASSADGGGEAPSWVPAVGGNDTNTTDGNGTIVNGTLGID